MRRERFLLAGRFLMANERVLHRIATGLLASTSMFAGVVHAEDSAPQAGQEIVVTAAGYEQNIAMAPASISVLSREEMELRPYTSLEDAVRYLEGVSIVGSDPSTTDVVIRGMPGEYTLYLLDGRRQSTRETMNRGTGGVQSSMLPPLGAIERIEVVRGPMSSLYGSDAMGGVVNVITRKFPERLSATVTGGYIVQEDDDYGDTGMANFWVGAPLANGKVGLQVYGGFVNRSEDDIFFPGPFASGANKSRDNSFSGKLAFLLSEGHDLVIEGGRNRLTYTETPGKSYDEEGTELIERHRRWHGSATYTGNWSFGSTKLAVYRENEKLSNIEEGELLNRPNLTNTVADALITMPVGRMNLNVGAQYTHAKVTGLQDQENVPGYVNVDKATRESWAVFAENKFQFTDTFAITGGARLDHYSSFGTHVTPRIYANYEVVPGLVLRGGIASGFKAPTLRQSDAGYCMTTGGSHLPRGPLCGNPDLDAETSVTREIGLRYDSEQGLGLGLTLFHTRFKNKVVSYLTDRMDPVMPTRPLYTYDNIDRVRIQGVEVSARVPVTETLELTANYTFTDSERRGSGEPSFDGSSLDGFPLDMTPKHMANVKLGWDATDRLHAYVSAYYIGKQWYTGFRNAAMGPRSREGSTTYDLGLSYQVTDILRLNAAALNLTDKIVPVDERGRFEGLDGNWMVDEGRRYWISATLSY